MKIDNTQETIDSRDVIERIEELEALLGNDEGTDENWQGTREEWDELASLKFLAAECEHVADWVHGEQLIREDYFTQYIEDLIDDCYQLPKKLTSGDWPYRHITIDYEAAAEEAKVDYEEVDFDGVTYFIRSV